MNLKTLLLNVPQISHFLLLWLANVLPPLGSKYANNNELMWTVAEKESIVRTTLAAMTRVYVGGRKFRAVKLSSRGSFSLIFIVDLISESDVFHFWSWANTCRQRCMIINHILQYKRSQRTLFSRRLFHFSFFQRTHWSWCMCSTKRFGICRRYSELPLN